MLVSHDRHLLRATTDQFLIVADGRLQPFDGDLDDYRDWLLKSKQGKMETSAPPLKAAAQKLVPTSTPKSFSSRKNLESRVKRLEEMIARLNAKKTELETKLADPAIYRDVSKKTLETALSDQADIGKELGELESEWLEKQAALEQLTA